MPGPGVGLKTWLFIPGRRGNRADCGTYTSPMGTGPPCAQGPQCSPAVHSRRCGLSRDHRYFCDFTSTPSSSPSIPMFSPSSGGCLGGLSLGLCSLLLSLDSIDWWQLDPPPCYCPAEWSTIPWAVMRRPLLCLRLGSGLVPLTL